MCQSPLTYLPTFPFLITSPLSVPSLFFSVDSQFKLRISHRDPTIAENKSLQVYEECSFNHSEVCLLPPSTAVQGTRRPGSHCSLHTNIPLPTIASGISGIFLRWFILWGLLCLIFNCGVTFFCTASQLLIFIPMMTIFSEIDLIFLCIFY